MKKIKTPRFAAVNDDGIVYGIGYSKKSCMVDAARYSDCTDGLQVVGATISAYEYIKKNGHGGERAIQARFEYGFYQSILTEKQYNKIYGSN